MHPEVRQDHPGSWPKRGMTLERVLPSLEDEGNPELTDFQRRFWWTLPLTVIVTVLATFGHHLGWFAMGTQSRIGLVLTLPVALWARWSFFVRGAQSIVHRSLRKVDTIIVDKTGTLAESRPTFERAIGAAGVAQA